MKNIKLMSSFFLPYQNANAFAIGKKIMGICDDYNIKVYSYNIDSEAKKSAFWESELAKTNIEIEYITKSNDKLLERGKSFFRKIKDIDKDGNIMISYFHLSEIAYLCLLLKKRDNIPWIAIYSDPPTHMSPFCYEENKQLKKKLINLILSFIPTYLTLKYSDKIVFNDMWQAKFILGKKFSKYESKIEIIQMGIEVDKEKKEVVNKDTYNNKIKFRYIGLLEGPRNAIEFLKAIDLMLEGNESYRDRVCIEFYGDVRSKETLEVYEKMKFKNNVKFYGYVYYEEAKILMKEADVLLVIDANLEDKVNIYPYTPSKILDYIGAQKPILAVSMNNSPTHDICIETDNWWSGFCIKNISNVMSECIENYKNHSYTEGVLSRYGNEEKSMQFKSLINNLIEKKSKIDS